MKSCAFVSVRVTWSSHILYGGRCKQRGSRAPLFKLCRLVRESPCLDSPQQECWFLANNWTSGINIISSLASWSLHSKLSWQLHILVISSFTCCVTVIIISLVYQITCCFHTYLSQDISVLRDISYYKTRARNRFHIMFKYINSSCICKFYRIIFIGYSSHLSMYVFSTMSFYIFTRFSRSIAL